MKKTRPDSTWKVLCKASEEAIRFSELASALRGDRALTAEVQPFSGVLEQLQNPGSLIAILGHSLTVEQIVSLLPHRARVVVCGSEPVDLFEDLGVAATSNHRNLLALLGLRRAGLLPGEPRITQLLSVMDTDKYDGRSDSKDKVTLHCHDTLTLAADGANGTELLGERWNVRQALQAMSRCSPLSRPQMPRVDSVDETGVRDALLGPKRSLSDPASKTVLSYYDVPLPLEELCTSASRAAAEASRIGFPVRVAMASPDLRVWDNPDLSLPGVDNAARVREVFRQLTKRASQSEGARMLGVTVSAMTPVRARLRCSLRPVRVEGLETMVHCHLGFSDAHGRASGDQTECLLPCTERQLANTVSRLSGSALLGHGTDMALIDALGDVLLRMAALIAEWSQHIDRIDIDPIAVSLDGRFEVVEACLHVSDAFERSLSASG